MLHGTNKGFNHAKGVEARLLPAEVGVPHVCRQQHSIRKESHTWKGATLGLNLLSRAPAPFWSSEPKAKAHRHVSQQEGIGNV